MHCSQEEILERLVTVSRVHVGVNLAAPPESGGTYQYSLSVVRGLDPRRTGWEATAFVAGSGVAFDPAAGVPMEMARSPRVCQALNAAYRRIDRSVGAHRRAAFVLPGSGPSIAAAATSSSSPARSPPPARREDRRSLRSMTSCTATSPTSRSTRAESSQGASATTGASAPPPPASWPTRSWASARSSNRTACVRRRCSSCRSPHPATSPSRERWTSGRSTDFRKQYLFYPAQFWEHKNHLSPR